MKRWSTSIRWAGVGKSCDVAVRGYRKRRPRGMLFSEPRSHVFLTVKNTMSLIRPDGCPALVKAESKKSFSHQKQATCEIGSIVHA